MGVEPGFAIAAERTVRVPARLSHEDEGRVLIRFNEPRETLQLRLSGGFKRFADEELRTVLTLLAGPDEV